MNIETAAFEKWYESDVDPVWGVPNVDLPDEKARRYARRVWDAAIEEAAKVFRTVSDSTGDYPIKPSDAEAAIRALAAKG